jgi:hypothetical protein
MIVTAEFCIWRNKEGQLVDWAVIYDPLLVNHPLGYRAEILARRSVQVVLQHADAEADAKKQALYLVVADVKENPALSRVRQEYGEIVAKGKAKPSFEVVEDREWQKMSGLV